VSQDIVDNGTKVVAGPVRPGWQLFHFRESGGEVDHSRYLGEMQFCRSQVQRHVDAICAIACRVDAERGALLCGHRLGRPETRDGFVSQIGD